MATANPFPAELGVFFKYLGDAPKIGPDMGWAQVIFAIYSTRSERGGGLGRQLINPVEGPSPESPRAEWFDSYSCNWVGYPTTVPARPVSVRVGLETWLADFSVRAPDLGSYELGADSVHLELENTRYLKVDAPTVWITGRASYAECTSYRATIRVQGMGSCGVAIEEHSIVTASEVLSMAQANGNKSVAMVYNTGSIARTKGPKSASICHADRSTAIVEGTDSVAVITGGESSCVVGFRGIGVITGASSSGEAYCPRPLRDDGYQCNSVLISTVRNTVLRGPIGTTLVFIDHSPTGTRPPTVKVVVIDGTKLKANTWYYLTAGLDIAESPNYEVRGGNLLPYGSDS